MRAKQRHRRAEIHRTRLARQGDFKLSALDAVTRERVALWAVALAGLEQLDPAENGELYVRALNSVSRCLAGLESRLREVGLDRGRHPDGGLAGYLRERYANGDGE